MRLTALALLAIALPAAAEFVVVEESESMTVYREGDQVIALLDDARAGQVIDFMNARASEPPIGTPVRDKAARGAGVKAYFSRNRLIDGKLGCEKVAARPAPEHRQYVLGVLAALPCRTGLL